MGLIGRRYTAAMPSRPVLIGRGLVPKPQTNKKNMCLQSATRIVSLPLPNTKQPVVHITRYANNPDSTHTYMGYQSYGGHSDRETPGPIPNPEVKPASADGTAPERWWESRTPPNILSNRGHPRGGLCCVGGPDWLPRQPQHHSDDPPRR